jgi:hypothetical protein
MLDFSKSRGEREKTVLPRHLNLKKKEEKDERKDCNIALESNIILLSDIYGW